MPSTLHEALLLLFRHRPRLAPEIVQGVLGVAIPEYEDVELQDTELSQITPTEYHADLVVLLNKLKQPVMAIVVEVQLRRDERKRYSWPLYLAALRAKLRCPVCVLVVTPSKSVARWAAVPIPLGPPGQTFTPLVLGPEVVPEVTSRSQACASPELAVLSVQAHGKKPQGLRLAMAAIAGASGLAEETAMLYSDLILAAVNDAARKELEAMMQSGTYEFQSDFAKRYIGKGRAEGRAEGEAKGRAEGEAEGEARGEAKGRLEALLRILAARGVAVSVEQRSRLQACQDIAQLDAWIDRAATATAAEHLFTASAAPRRASRRR